MHTLDLEALTARWLAALGLADPRVALAALVDPAAGSGADDPGAIPPVSLSRGMWLVTRLADARIPAPVATVLEGHQARYLGDLVARPPEWLDAVTELSPRGRQALLDRLAWAGLGPAVAVHGWPPASVEALCRLAALARLAEWRQGRTGRDSRCLRLLGRAVPAWAASLLGDVRLLGIGDTLARRLEAAGFHHVGDLARLAEAQMVAAARLDPDAVQLLEQQLASRGVWFEMSLPNWPPPGLAILADEAAAYLGSSRSAIPRLGRPVTWIRADPSRPRSSPPKTPERRRPPATIDEEISWLLDFATRKGQREAAVACFGWDGRPPQQQAEVGARLGISLEHVQQLCQRLRRRWAAAAPATPHLEGAFREVAAFTGAAEDEVTARLPRARIGLEGILAAWRALGRAAPPRIETLGGRRVVVQKPVMWLAGRVQHLAHHAVHSRGLATVEEIRAKLAKSPPLRVSRGFVEAALAERPDVHWLGTPDGAFWYTRMGSHNPLARRILKVLRVARRASIDVIVKGIRRSWTPRKPVPGPELLLAMCARIPGLRVEGREVSLEAASAADHREGRIEAALAERLRQLGRAASLHEVRGWCRELGIKPDSARAFLMISPMFTSVMRGFYALRGHESVPGGPVVPKARGSGPGRAQCGRLPDGRPWLTFEMNRRWRAQGRFPVPPALARMVDGAFELRISGERTLGRVYVTPEFGVGIERFYVVHHPLPRTAVALVFDPATRTVRGSTSPTSGRRALEAAANPRIRLSGTRVRRGAAGPSRATPTSQGSPPATPPRAARREPHRG